jgi:hypothetical protein
MPLTQPSRWDRGNSNAKLKHWGKKIKPHELCLAQRGGFALGGNIVNWNQDVTLAAGEYLVVAYETGKNKDNAVYVYHLLEVSGGELIPVDEVLVDQAVTCEQDRERKAKAVKSRLYAYALFLAVRHNQGTGPLPAPIIAANPKEQARQALLALPFEERCNLIDEVLALGSV